MSEMRLEVFEGSTGLCNDVRKSEKGLQVKCTFDLD